MTDLSPAAQRFLGLLPPDVPRPHDVWTDPDGDARFTWCRGDRLIFEVSVDAGGTLHYAGIFGEVEPHGTCLLDDPLPAVLVAGIRRVMDTLTCGDVLDILDRHEEPDFHPTHRFVGIVTQRADFPDPEPWP